MYFTLLYEALHTKLAVIVCIIFAWHENINLKTKSKEIRVKLKKKLYFFLLSKASTRPNMFNVARSKKLMIETVNQENSVKVLQNSYFSFYFLNSLSETSRPNELIYACHKDAMLKQKARKFE